MSKYLLFFTVLFLWCNASLARQKVAGKEKGLQFPALPSEASPDARQYVFTRFSTFTGLASNMVNNLVQDRKGYIWLATPNGLQRYDGNKFITFKHQHRNPLTLPDDNVGRVYLDKQNRLWVLTADNKVGIFDTDHFTYQAVTLQWHGAPPTVFVGKLMVETREGKLLLMMGWHDVYEFVPASNSFVVTEKIAYKPAAWKRYSYFYDTLTGRSWLGCDSGLVMYDPATKHTNYRGHNPDNNKIIEALGNIQTVLQCHIDEKGFALLATWDKLDAGPRLHSYDNRTGERKKHAVTEELYGGGYNEINGVLQQRNGRLWVFGLPFIAEYVGGRQALQGLRNEYKDEQSIKFDVALYMYEDRAQNLWVCTSNGLFLFNPDAQFFNAYSLLRPDGAGPVDGPSKSILEPDSSQVWVGGWGVGLFAYDKNFRPQPLPLSLQKYKGPFGIWCMQRHPATRDIWMGIQDGLMLIYKQATGKTEEHWFDVFEKRTVRQMVKDHQGNLWFGTQGGLVVKWTYRPGQNVKEGFTLVTRTGLIQKLFVDKDGYVWVGTLGWGLLKVDPATNTIIERYGSKTAKGSRLWNDSPSDIVQLNDSILAIACHGLSLLNVKTKKITFLSTDEGLPANNIMCLAKDRRGVLWLGMISGICRVNLEKMTFTYYDRRDGMPADYFEVDDAHHLEDGRILFTSAHHFVVFDPGKMIKNQPPPNVVITDVSIAGTSLSVDSLSKLFAIHLQHDKSFITIEFGNFNFTRQDKTDYYYQLVGVDNGWVHAMDRRQAIYNYLRPGNYVFKVKSKNADGVESTAITSLRISVEPPFWRTWWFYGFLALVAIVILYWIDRERMRRIRELQAMRTQIASNLHGDINTTLNNINMLSEMAKIKADKDLTRSKEYIDQISEKSHNMIIAMDDMLWSIDPQNDSMEKTLLRMLEFVDALINRHGANIDILVDEHVRSLEIDMKSRHEMFLIFKEVLRSMVALGTRHHHILINIDLVKSKLSLKMQDDGVYAGEGELFSIQALNMLARRAETIHAELDIQADKNGASIILLVPVS